MKTTTIQIHFETKELLDKIGKKGDTYDDIILGLALKALSQKKEAKK